MDRVTQLGNEKIGKLILTFSTPAIAGLLIYGLNRVISGIFIGRGLGSDALTGFSIAYSFILLLLGFPLLVGIGNGSLISIKLGEKDKEGAEKALGNALLFSFALSIIIILLSIAFLDQILYAFGARGKILVFARNYTEIYLIGTFFQIASYVLNGAIRAEGNPPMALTTSIIGFIINTILIPVFIYVFPFGIAGAALATVIYQFIVTVWTILYFSGKKSHIKLHPKDFIPDSKMISKIVMIGISPFMVQFIGSATTMLVNNIAVIYGGNDAIAAIGVIFSIYFLLMMPLMGINQGIQPIFGYNHGAKNFNRVKKTLRISLTISGLICLTEFLFIMSFNEKIIRLFAPGSDNIVRIGSEGLRIVLMVLPLIGFQIIGTSYFQAVGKPKQAILLNLLRSVIILLPLLFVLHNFLQLLGVYICWPIADIFSAFAAIFLLFLEYKGLALKSESKLSEA